MWYSNPNQKPAKEIIDVNHYLEHLSGDLEDFQAKITFSQFLYRNLKFTTEALTGISLYPDQLITLKAMLKRNFCLNIWSRGLGKSLYYNDLNIVIEKTKGITSLKNLFPGLEFQDEDYWLEFPEIELWNGNEWQKANKILVQKGKDTTKITTRMGYDLEGSTVHKIKVLDTEKCEVVWKEYDQLKIGDFACISHSKSDWGNKEAPLEESEEAYLVGLLIGDGTFVKTNLCITGADQEILDFCRKYSNLSVRYRKGTKVFELNFPKPFSDYLRSKYGFNKEKSYFKSIPKNILASKVLLKHFLQGLLDTDGWIENKTFGLGYCSVSETLAKQVHLSLLSFGIISKFRLKKTKSNFGKAYCVELNGDSVKTFIEEVGFRLGRKKKICEDFLSENVSFNTNVKVIPGAKRFCEKVKAKHRLPNPLSREWRRDIKRRSQKEMTLFSLSRTLNFFRKCNFPELEYKNIQDLINSNFFFDEIKEIKHSRNNCIDFNIPNGEMYWSNGFISHNTFISAVYCILQAITEPGTKILIAGPTFRTSRFIFNHIEKMTQGVNGKMLFDILGKPVKRPDEFKWIIGTSEITAIPLNQEKIRGYRANVLFIDELLLMSEEMIEKILMPFLVSPQDIAERKRVRTRENALIRKGLMKEEDRKVFKNKSKFIGLSSASYTCEYLYRKYEEYVKHIYSDDISKDGDKYFISQMAWNGVNNYEDRMEETIIKAAETEANSANFKREYGAQFIDGSDSYFSMAKMIKQTIPDGETPTLLLKGDKDKKYILSFDASGSNSARGDDFAMCVIELEENFKSGTVVHSYAEAGKDLKDHIKYFHYLMTNFNVVMICGDHAGHHQFLDSANESQYFKHSGIRLELMDFNSAKEGVEFEEELKKAKRLYNLQSKRIVFTVLFREDSIRRMNEHLQGCIDFKKIWFGSSIKGDVSSFSKATSSGVNPTDFGYQDLTEMIDDQEILLKQTKYQCASIEIKTSSRGSTTFDLPMIMKRDQSATRMRKDSYTAILLGCWGMKTYGEIMSVSSSQTNDLFTPFFVA